MPPLASAQPSSTAVVPVRPTVSGPEPPGSPGLQRRAGRSLMRGIGQAGEAIGGAAQFIGQTATTAMPAVPFGIAEAASEAGARLSKASEELAAKWTPPDYVTKSILEDPGQLLDGGWWADNFPALLPSMAVFLVPGAAGGFVAGTAGAVLSSSIANGLFTAGSVYNEIVKKGGSPQEAANRAALTFAVDAPLTALQAGSTARLARSGAGRIAKALGGAGDRKS